KAPGPALGGDRRLLPRLEIARRAYREGREARVLLHRADRVAGGLLVAARHESEALPASAAPARRDAFGQRGPGLARRAVPPVDRDLPAPLREDLRDLLGPPRQRVEPPGDRRGVQLHARIMAVY